MKILELRRSGLRRNLPEKGQSRDRVDAERDSRGAVLVPPFFILNSYFFITFKIGEG